MRPHRPGGVHQCGLLPPRPFGALQALRSGKAGSVGGLRAWAVILGWMCSYMWVLSSPHICHFIRSFEFLFWHQRSFAQSFSKWSFPLPTQWSIALNTTIRMCRTWQFAKCSGASESNQSCANWPPMRGCSQSRPSPCSAMTSQPSRLLWRLWSQTQPRSALTFQNKSSRWPLWRRSGRHAALCRIISPLGEPRWKKIHQRFQRFPEKIMQNFVKFLSLDTLTFSSLCIGSHIASLLREFSATSLCTASSTSTKSERSGRGMSRSHRRQGWRRTQKICSVSSWSINLLLQAQSLRSWTSCTHSSSRSSTSTFVSSRSRPAPWSTCLSSKNGAKRTGAWLSCSPWIVWSSRRCTVSVQISASSSALSPRRCSKCSPTISSYGTMLAQAQSSTSSGRLPTQLSQSRPRSAHGQAQQMLLGPPRSPRRTKLGGSARRPSSRRQRRCSTILPSKGASQVPLAPPKMSGYPRRSGRQSPPSSTQALAAVLSSIAHWAADSVINASSSTPALNVARIILGTATTDVLMGIPRWLPRHHLGIGSARPVARMMLMRPRRLGRQCLRWSNWLSHSGMRLRLTFRPWRPKPPFSWSSLPGRQASRRPFICKGSLCCRQLTSLLASLFSNPRILWICWCWTSWPWASCSSCTVAHRATRSRQLASSMAGHRHFDRQRLHWVWTGSAGLISYWFFLVIFFLNVRLRRAFWFLMLVGIS